MFGTRRRRISNGRCSALTRRRKSRQVTLRRCGQKRSGTDRDRVPFLERGAGRPTVAGHFTTAVRLAPRACALRRVGPVGVVREHSFSGGPRETLLSFLNDTLCGLAENIDKSFFKPEGVLDVKELLDGKLLRKHVDRVLKAIDSVSDPIEREDAFYGLLRIAMASLQIGMGLSNTAAKKKSVKALLAAVSAKRSISEDVDRAIAALAEPLTKHAKWSANRVAIEIADPLNKQLRALGFKTLGLSAIRKRVKRRRTNVRASD